MKKRLEVDYSGQNPGLGHLNAKPDFVNYLCIPVLSFLASVTYSVKQSG